MTIKHLLTTNLIVLAQRLKDADIDLDNTFILDNGQFLNRENRLKLQAMQCHIHKDITAVKSITIHLEHNIDNRIPLPGEPGSDPIADKYRSQTLEQSERVSG